MEKSKLIMGYRDLRTKAIKEIERIETYYLGEDSLERRIRPEETKSLIQLVQEGRLVSARETLKRYPSEHSTMASKYLLEAITAAVNYVHESLRNNR